MTPEAQPVAARVQSEIAGPQGCRMPWSPSAPEGPRVNRPERWVADLGHRNSARSGRLSPRRLTGRLGSEGRWVEALGDQPHRHDHLLQCEHAGIPAPGCDHHRGPDRDGGTQPRPATASGSMGQPGRRRADHRLCDRTRLGRPALHLHRQYRDTRLHPIGWLAWTWRESERRISGSLRAAGAGQLG
jgi:hypothetical protein